MVNKRRVVLFFLLSLVLTGCGTTSRAQLVMQLPAATSFVVFDERSPEQKVSQTIRDQFGDTVVYGDDSLEPVPVDMFKAKVQELDLASLTGKEIKLTKFYVRVFEPQATVDMQRVYRSSASVPGGYAAAPLAGLFILGIEKAKSLKDVMIDVEGNIEGKKFSAFVTDQYRGRVTEENIKTSLLNALQQTQQAILHIDDQPSVATASEGGESVLSQQCSVNVDSYVAQARVLMADKKYSAAMACFMAAQQDRTHADYREACFGIALLYELGWGVGRNIETAKYWIAKADE